MELKSIITEIKNSLEGLDSRFELAEERINKLEDKSIETMQAEEQRGKKYTKTPVVEVPEKKWERGAERTFEEIMAENFPNLKKALIYTRK